MSPILEVDGLSTRLTLPNRTVYAVDDISFAIEPGETVGLVGESGSGKSMTGASLTQLLPEGGHIASGRIRLDGRELTGLAEDEMRKLRGSEIGLISQDPLSALNPTATIGRQVAEPLLIHGRAGRKEARKRAIELLGMVGIPKPEERIDSYPHQLSGGLRQRVCIAIALACEPKLLIADEPTTALDVTVQDQILTLLQRLKQELRMSVLLITHDMGVIAEHADRVLVMYAGRIIESAQTGDLFRHTRHPYTEALLESIPHIDQRVSEGLYSIPGTPPDLTEPLHACAFAPRCRYATAECADTIPPMALESGGHQFACFHPRAGSPPRVPLPGDAPASGQQRALLLRVQNVTREYQLTSPILQRQIGSVKAVSDVSFDVYAGETVGIVGESGCGKTTIGKLIVGLEQPDHGTIELQGSDVTGHRRAARLARSRVVQMIFQDPYASLDPRMRVNSILAEPLVVQRTYSKTERQDRIYELLREVGLADAAAQLLPREFSGGQRQRIGFARALALNPSLIVADEPVSALDVSIRAQLLNLMRRLQAEHNLTYIMISHDLSVVRYLADRVGVMYLGKLVEIGDNAAIYERPAHPYTAGLLEAAPVPDPESAKHRERIALRGELPSSISPPSGCRFRTRCSRAQDICAEQEPPMVPFDEFGHLAACHFPLQPVLQREAWATR